MATGAQLRAWLVKFRRHWVRLFASVRVQLRARAGPATLFACTVALMATLSILQVALGSKPHDFLSYYFAAQVASHGANFYDASVLQNAATAQSVHERVYPYLYSPVLAHAMRGFAGLKLPHAHALWLLLNISAFILALTGLLLAAHKTLLKGPSLRENLALLLLTAAVLIAALPLRSNVLFGQVNPLVLVFICMAVSSHWMGFRTLTGICLAPAILIKLTPAVLLLFFVARGDRRVVGACLVALVVLAGTTLPFGAAADWMRFVRHLPEHGHGETIPGLFPASSLWNFAPAGFLSRVFDEPTLWIRRLSVLAILGACALAIHCAVRARSVEQERLALAGFFPVLLLASPLMYLHHVVYLLPAAATWMLHAWQRGRSLLFTALLVSLFVAGTDWPSLYSQLFGDSPPELYTSINLYAVILLWALGWTLTRQESEPLVATSPSSPLASSPEQ